ncbi:MAG: calcium-binding protein [Pseudomonadota bacterium]
MEFVILPFLIGAGITALFLDYQYDLIDSDDIDDFLDDTSDGSTGDPVDTTTDDTTTDDARFANTQFMTDAGDFDGGSSLDDQTDGAGGDDTLSGAAGNDVLIGASGNDDIYGGDGRDIIVGGEGSEHIQGGNGDDILIGNNGADTIFGNDDDSSTTATGSDNDLIFAGFGGDKAFGADGDDTIVGHRGDDTIRGGSGDDVITGNMFYTATMTKGNAYEIINNDAVNNPTDLDNGFKDEGQNNDFGALNMRDDFRPDVLLGDAGNDTLYLGEGDSAAGGLGNDEFIIGKDAGATSETVATGGNGAIITDFVVGTDTLVVEYNETTAPTITTASATIDGVPYTTVLSNGQIVANVVVASGTLTEGDVTLRMVT